MFRPPEGASSEEFRNELISFISQVEYSELVTVADNQPHIRPMVYVNEGLTIYMVSRKHTAKIRQIAANPNVSVVIIKSFRETSNTKEVLIEGKACFVRDDSRREKVFKMFEKKPATFQEWRAQDYQDFEVIEIKPSLLRYFDYSQGDNMPLALKID